MWGGVVCFFCVWVCCRVCVCVCVCLCVVVGGCVWGAVCVCVCVCVLCVWCVRVCLCVLLVLWFCRARVRRERDMYTDTHIRSRTLSLAHFLCAQQNCECRSEHHS